eukprot:543714_1
MGNKQSSAKNTKNEETTGSSLMDQLLPWQCIKCKKANHEHVLRCISCHSANPELEPNGFIRDILDDKKEDTKKNIKQKRKSKNIESKLKNSLLTTQEIQAKFDKFFPNNINKNLNNENKNDENEDDDNSETVFDRIDDIIFCCFDIGNWHLYQDTVPDIFPSSNDDHSYFYKYKLKRQKLLKK